VKSLIQVYERVRHEEFPEKLGRLRSYFAFATLEDLDRFKERSHKLHSKVSFEIDDVCVSHVGDMELLDQITAEMNAIEAFQMVRRYWQGERTLLPLLEYLVQGELTLELIN